MISRIDSTRQSWNLATRNHNAHKGDQAAFFRAGGDTLFPEELDLLGDIRGARLLHIQCNAGQDTLSLARRGALATGVDLSDVAIGFARDLSADAGIAARFIESEIITFLQATAERFEIAFASYGALGWNEDLGAWASGVKRVLTPGGRLVLVEFHPLVWSVGKNGALDGDDYFADAPFSDPVSDYVAQSGAGLLAVTDGPTEENPTPAWSWQHGLGATVDALARAGLRIERMLEYPYSNGCKVNPTLIPAEGRRWVWPEGVARTPLMFGLAARRED